MKARSPKEGISENSLNPSGLVRSSLAVFIKDFHVMEEVGVLWLHCIFRAGNTTRSDI